MGFLQVDLDALARAASDMTDSVDRLRDARGKLSRAGGLVIGPPVLGDAADEFQRSWHAGIDRLAELATACVRGLDLVRTRYRAGDSALAAALHRLEDRSRS